MNAATSLDTDIPRFARQVRAALDDLPADDIDDILDGLEADLAEQAADRAEDFTLPDAAAYAAELRAAAGLPPRADHPASVPLRARVVAVATGVADRVRANPAGGWILELLVSVRPAWWVLRGFVIFVCLAVPLGLPLRPDGTPLSWLFIAALTVLSVQWGRGRWLPHAWLRAVRTVVNVVTAIVGVVLLISAPTVVPQWYASTESVEYIDILRPGMAVDGVRVRNVFAYDAEGNPLTDVQLFDQDGRPLTTTGADAEGESWQWDMFFFGGGGPVPVPVNVPGRLPMWNVFPLHELSGADAVYGDDGEPRNTADAEPALPPYERVPALPSVEGSTPEPTPTPPAPEPAPTVVP